MSQSARLWLKALAPLNVYEKLSTRETSQTPMGWLKAAAPLKVDASVVTADVFHWLMSPLKVTHAGCWSAPVPFENRNERSVTCEMSHCAIGPYAAAASVTSTHHALRASSSSERLVKTCGGAGARTARRSDARRRHLYCMWAGRTCCTRTGWCKTKLFYGTMTRVVGPGASVGGVASLVPYAG